MTLLGPHDFEMKTPAVTLTKPRKKTHRTESHRKKLAKLLKQILAGEKPIASVAELEQAERIPRGRRIIE